MSALDGVAFGRKSVAITSTLSESSTVPLWRLRNQALTPGGFLTASLRRKVWPKLVGVNRFESSEFRNTYDDGTSSLDSKIIDQVKRDVERSLWHFQTPADCKSPSKNKNLRKKQKLVGGVIVSVLEESRESKSGSNSGNKSHHLHYYQGYHDITSIFLMTLTEPALVTAVLSNVSKSHLSDAMSSDFTSLILALRLLIFPMLHNFDPELHAFLVKSKVEPFFALSWVITWFSHDIRNVETASRLVDAFIASHPLLPVYMSVALLLHPFSRKLILATECDFPMVHQALCSLPQHCKPIAVAGSESSGGVHPTLTVGDGDIDWQDLIDVAITMMRSIPPRNLRDVASKYTFNGGLSKAIRESSNCSIGLFQPPPSWGLAGSVPSDWALLKIARSAVGKKATSNAVKKHRSITRKGTPLALEYEDISTTDGFYTLTPYDDNKMAKLASGVTAEMNALRRAVFWFSSISSYKGGAVGVTSLAILLLGFIIKDGVGQDTDKFAQTIFSETVIRWFDR
jgi:hypothetical protein